MKMALLKISKEDKSEIASLFADYWKSRGMSRYNELWAKEYLETGHKKEISEDEFFVYKESENIIGVIALVVDVSGVAEIRDLVIAREYEDKNYEKIILKEIIKIAKQKNLHKIYELVFPGSENIYYELGFEKEGLLKSHFAKKEDLVIMSKFL